MYIADRIFFIVIHSELITGNFKAKMTHDIMASLLIKIQFINHSGNVNLSVIISLRFILTFILPVDHHDSQTSGRDGMITSFLAHDKTSSPHQNALKSTSMPVCVTADSPAAWVAKL